MRRTYVVDQIRRLPMILVSSNDDDEEEEEDLRETLAIIMNGINVLCVDGECNASIFVCSDERLGVIPLLIR